MTLNDFKKLKEGSKVVLNGKCRNNKGRNCIVTAIFPDDRRIWVKPCEGFFNSSDWVLPDLNEISYLSADIGEGI